MPRSITALVRLLHRHLVAPLTQLPGAPARGLARLSDDADDVWKPFLDDEQHAGWAVPARPEPLAA